MSSKLYGAVDSSNESTKRGEKEKWFIPHLLCENGLFQSIDRRAIP